MRCDILFVKNTIGQPFLYLTSDFRWIGIFQGICRRTQISLPPDVSRARLFAPFQRLGAPESHPSAVFRRRRSAEALPLASASLSAVLPPRAAARIACTHMRMTKNRCNARVECIHRYAYSPTPLCMLCSRCSRRFFSFSKWRCMLCASFSHNLMLD